LQEVVLGSGVTKATVLTAVELTDAEPVINTGELAEATGFWLGVCIAAIARAKHPIAVASVDRNPSGVTLRDRSAKIGGGRWRGGIIGVASHFKF
jgi:hypothetical protein